MKKIYYNSSMPRAGSTLLQNIIGQNPEFYVTPTSGLLELCYAARANYSSSPEFKAQDSTYMQKAFLSFCKGGMNAYFESLTDKPYVVDKSRGWGIHYNFLNQINPEPKIVCVIRDLRDIISSMEKIYRKNQHLHDSITNHSSMKGTTVGKRVDIWLSSQPIGLAIERVQEILVQNLPVYFIRYEDLLTNPQSTMDCIYKYFGVESYQHDFTNIPQITVEDDAVYGLGNLHSIQTKLGTIKHDYKEVIGAPISNFLKEKYSWYFEKFGYK
jgi:sulfotransferase